MENRWLPEAKQRQAAVGGLEEAGGFQHQEGLAPRYDSASGKIVGDGNAIQPGDFNRLVREASADRALAASGMSAADRAKVRAEVGRVGIDVKPGAKTEIGTTPDGRPMLFVGANATAADVQALLKGVTPAAPKDVAPGFDVTSRAAGEPDANALSKAEREARVKRTGTLENNQLSKADVDAQLQYLVDNPHLLKGKPPNREAKLGEHTWKEKPGNWWCRHSGPEDCKIGPDGLKAENAPTTVPRRESPDITDPGLADFVKRLQDAGITVTNVNIGVMKNAGHRYAEIDVVTPNALIEYKDGKSSAKEIIDQIQDNYEPHVDRPTIAFVKDTGKAGNRTVKGAADKILITNDFNLLVSLIR